MLKKLFCFVYGIKTVIPVSSVFCLAFFVMVCMAPMAMAANISMSEKPGCFYELSGIIRGGDEETFARLVNATWSGAGAGMTEDNADTALCLDSRGGHFVAASAISQILYEKGIATRVRAGSDCQSACSVVFMAGRVRGAEGEGPRRILDVGGALGFHAPFVELQGDADFKGQNVMEYVVKHNTMISDFIKFGLQQSQFSLRPSMSPALLAEMMAHKPGEMYWIDSVEKAARWNIGLSGLPEKVALSDEDLVRLCTNQLSWIYDVAAPTRSLASTDAQLNSYSNWLYVSEVTFLSIVFPGMVNKGCDVERPRGPANGLVYCLADAFTGLSLGQCRDRDNAFGEYSPWWHAMHPGTRLDSLAQR